MANGIRRGDLRGFNKGRSSKFREGSRVRQTPEKCRRTHLPKRWGVRKSIRQSWLAKGLGLGLLCWGFKGVQEKRPALFLSGMWHFHQDNTPVHNSILVRDYLVGVRKSENQIWLAKGLVLGLLWYTNVCVCY